MPLKLELVAEIILERPLSLAELVRALVEWKEEFKPASAFTAESGLSGSGLLWPALALLLVLFRCERSEFPVCVQQLFRA